MNESIKSLKDVKIGYAICGSFCTFEKTFEQIELLIEMGSDVTVIMSYSASETDTRFGKALEHIDYLEKITGKPIIKSIEGAEPIGPKFMCDILIVAPCTGNTLAKLALGIIDTPVTMAVKSHIRNAKPVVLAVATNDGLAGSAKNLGYLLNYKEYYFVPLEQDDYINKPKSLVSDFNEIPETILNALNGKQLQPIYIK